MKLIFIDEVYGSRDSNVFGVGVLIVDATKYDLLKCGFQEALNAHSWPIGTEIKGKHIFSRDPSQTRKTPDQMIALTRDLISNLLSPKTARAELLFVYNKERPILQNYLGLVKKAITKLKKNPDKKSGKHLVFLHLDSFTALRQNQTKAAKELEIALISRGYCLVEGSLSVIESSNSSPGIIYADLLAYLARWVVENPDVTATDLTELIIADTGAVNTQKAKIAKDILGKIKSSIIKI